MKKLLFAVVSAGSLAVAGCSGNNQDTVDNAEMNQPAPEMNAMGDPANDAANSEAAALGTQQQQLEDENAAAEDNATNPTDEVEQNVSGM